MSRLLYAALLLTGAPLWATGVADTPPPANNIFSHFWGLAETIHTIESKSLRAVSLESIIEEGMRAMVTKVDAHSAFFSPRSYQATLEHAAGQFPGIGVSIVSKETEADSLLIVEALPGGPARQAGIQSGDTLIKVDGQRLRGLTSDEVVTRLKGPVGTTVNITILRNKKPLKFTLTRQLIQDKSTYAYFFPAQETTYIALRSFSETAPTQLNEYLTKAYERKSKGIIIDLRKNPGGVFESAIKAASALLPDHSLVVSTKNKMRETVSTHYTTGTPIYRADIPLMVLTDNFTASCSEILCGSLQHYAAALNLPIFLLGGTTYGKGSVQEIIPLHNGCALKLTTMLYYVAGQHCIQAAGVTPDITLHPKTASLQDLKWTEELYGKEASLSNHITRAEVTGSTAIAARATPAHSPEEEAEPKNTLRSDYVVQSALTMINMWHLHRRQHVATPSTHEEEIALLQKMVVTAPFGVEDL